MKRQKRVKIFALGTAIMLSITGCGKENETPVAAAIYDNILNNTYEDMVSQERDQQIKIPPLTEEDFVLEIHDMLKKYDMTYQELVELVLNTPEYNQALQEVLTESPIFTKDKLINVLQGKETMLRENLYIGDSRTQGMLINELINEELVVYGSGYGYDWFIGDGAFSSDRTNATNGAIEGLKSKMIDNKCYNIIIWLGVNDYTYVTANTYFEKFEELAVSDWSNHNIYIVSVGPVKNSLASYANNIGIDSFNSSLKELVTNSNIDNLYYIDLNLDEYSISHYDDLGLHYGESDNQNIFNIINEATSNTNISSINILSIFYSALNSYGENFNDYYIDNNEVKKKIK